MRRSILGILLGVALSAVGVVIAGLGIENPPDVARIWPIALAVLVMLAVWLIQGTVLALLARPELKTLRVLDMTRLYLATQAVGAMTPFGGVEVGYQLLEFQRRGLSADYGGAVMTIKGIFNGTFLVGGAAVGILFVSGIPIIENWYLVAALAGIAVMWALFAFLVGKVRGGGGRSSGGGESRGSRLSRWREKLSEFLRNIVRSLRSIWRQDPRVVVASGFLMLLYWLLYPLLGVLALMAAGWSGEGWLAVFMAQFVLYFVIPFAPTPGNSGAAELAFTALMGVYVPEGSLLAGVLIWRALNHYSELVVGAFIAGRHIEDDIRLAREELQSSG